MSGDGFWQEVRAARHTNSRSRQAVVGNGESWSVPQFSGEVTTGNTKALKRL